MTIQQLEYFLKTAELLNLTRVSEVLQVSQPSVSYAIRELEKQYHITLFKRTSSGLKLTREGAVFYERTKQLLAHINSFEQTFLNMSFEPVTIRCGTISLYASSLPFVYRYGCEHGMKCNFILDIRETLEEAFRSDLLDLVITDHPCLIPHSESIRIARKKLSFCAHPELFYSDKKKISIQDISGLPFINYEGLIPKYQKHFESTEQFSFQPDIVLTTNQIATCINFAVNKIGVVFIPDFFFTKTDVRSYEVTGLPENDIYIWYPSGNTNAEKLCRYLKTVGNQILTRQESWNPRGEQQP